MTEIDAPQSSAVRGEDHHASNTDDWVFQRAQEAILLKCKSDLQRIVDAEHTVSYISDNNESIQHSLKELDDATVTIESLKHTEIAKLLVKVKKIVTEDDSLLKAISNLIEKWKKIAVSEFRSHNSHSPMEEPERKRRRSSSVSSSNGNDHSHSHHLSATSSVNEETEEIRHKSCKLIQEALKGESLIETEIENPDPSAGGLSELAAEIESEIFEGCGENVDSHYKAQIRRCIFNLRDKKNPRLREALLTGLIDPKRFATMTPDEMASPELRATRIALEEEALKDHALPESGNMAEHSTMWQCHKCHTRDVNYTVSEERLEGEIVSATSVVCAKCGHRWKSF